MAVLRPVDVLLLGDFAALPVISMGHAVVLDETSGFPAAVLLCRVRLRGPGCIDLADRERLVRRDDRTGVTDVRHKSRPASVRHLFKTLHFFPYRLAAGVIADLSDADARELPFVVAFQLDVDAGEFRDALERDHELDRASLGQTVLIGEVHDVAWPVAVERTDGVFDAVRSARSRFPLHVVKVEGDRHIADRTCRQDVVRRHGDQIAVQTVFGLQHRRMLGFARVIGEREYLGGTHVRHDAFDGRRRAVAVGVQLSGRDVEQQRCAVSAFEISVAGSRAVSGEAQNADLVFFACLCSLSEDRVRAFCSQTCLRYGSLFACDDGDGSDLYHIRQQRRNDQRVALLRIAADREIAGHIIDGPKRIDDQRQENVALAVIHVRVADRKSSSLTEPLLGDIRLCA